MKRKRRVEFKGAGAGQKIEHSEGVITIWPGKIGGKKDAFCIQVKTLSGQVDNFVVSPVALVALGALTQHVVEQAKRQARKTGSGVDPETDQPSAES